MDKQSADKRAQVQRLNDMFRRAGIGRGTWLHTDGIHARGPDFVLAATAAVRAFNGFNRDNDPYGEHDFGAFMLFGERLFFKIDYYDLALTAHSLDAADPAQTHRVMTIMFASEY